MRRDARTLTTGRVVRPGIRPNAGTIPNEVLPALGFVAIAGCATILVVVGRIAELIPGLAQLQPAKITLGLFILSALIGRRQLAQSKLLESPIVRTAFWFFALAALSGVYSIWRSNSLTFVVNGLLVITLVFALIFKVVRSWTIARALIFTLCASGALLGAAAILGYHGARAEAGVTYDTNDLAYLLVTTLPLAVALAIDGTGWRRWLFGSMAGAMIVATLLTESRGGLLGLFAGLLAVLWLRPTAVNAKTGAMGRISKTLVWAVIATLIGVASWPLLPASARERFASLLNIESDYNVQEEDVGRTFIWRRNLKAVAKRPIGYGVASSSALDLRLGGRFKTAHNSVVQIATELGVLGAFLFLRLYWLAWRQLSAQSARMRERATAATERIARSDVPVILYALRASLVASFVAGFFLSQGYSYLLYTLLGLIAAVALLDSNAGVTSSTPVASKWTRQRR